MEELLAHRRLNTSYVIWAISALFGLLAALAWITGAPSGPPIPTVDAPFWALAGSFAAAEVFVAHLQFRSEAYTYSASEIPLVLGLLFADPAVVVLAHLAGSGLALALHRRQRPMKLAYNLSHLGLETVVAIAIHREVLGTADAFSAAGWLAVFLATFVASTLNVLSIVSAISLTEGRLGGHQIAQTTLMAVGIAMTNTSLAMAAAHVIERQPVAGAVLMLPAVAIVAAYRAYVRQRDRHDRLEFLHEATRAFHADPRFDVALLGMLEQACSMFRADVAEVVVLPPAGDSIAHRTIYRSDGLHDSMEAVRLGSRDPIWAAVAIGGPTIVKAGDATASQRTYLDERGIDDAMLAPLRGEARLLGFAIIGNRRGDVAGFSGDDLRLFETLGRHVAVTLENDRLESALTRLTELEHQLSHQAFHDPLTGLANRALFTAELERRLGASGPRNPLAVLFVDLDDFKAINDQHGHATGDAVLNEVAERLRRCVRPDDVVARLGGDEFAVLIGSRHGDTSVIARRVVKLLRNAADHPISASVGLARATPGDSVEDVLRNADTAMYEAKAQGKGQLVEHQQGLGTKSIDSIGADR